MEMETIELYSYSVIKKRRAQGKIQYSKTVMIKNGKINVKDFMKIHVDVLIHSDFGQRFEGIAGA